MFDWLKSQRDMTDCGHGSPVRAVAAQGMLGPNFIAAHVNHLWIDDARLLAKAGAHVVHCPSSRAYFGHRMFPFEQLVEAGVNVCLGTDSAASLPKLRGGRIPSLSLFDEMRCFASNYVAVPPERILGMVTMNAAKAVGRAGELGELSVGAKADLVVIHGSARVDAFETLITQTSAPDRVMIDGVWVLDAAQ
jgi:cytosine/adenosine deaminase-related metal-dependent hydrolase